MRFILNMAVLALISALCFPAPGKAETAASPAFNIDISHTFKWNSQSIDALATNAAYIVKQNCRVDCTLSLRVYVTRPISRVGLKKIERLHREILKKIDGLDGGSVEIIDTIQLI